MTDCSWLVSIFKTWFQVFLLAGVVGALYVMAFGVSKWYWSIIDQVEDRKEKGDL